jgi:hypothetical protein
MHGQYGKDKGERVFWAYVNRRGLDETKPMKGQSGTKMKPTPPSERTVKEEYGAGPAVSEAPFKPNKDVKKLDEELREALNLLPKADPPIGTLHVDNHPEIIPPNVPHIVGPPGAIPMKSEETKGVTTGNNKGGPSGKERVEPTDASPKYSSGDPKTWEKPKSTAPDAVDTSNKPWYEQNRPYGAPLSPFQKVTAEKFNSSFNEILAAFSKMDNSSKPSPEKDKAGSKVVHDLLEKAFLSSQI